jgi:hypothetical protein
VRGQNILRASFQNAARVCRFAESLKLIASQSQRSNVIASASMKHAEPKPKTFRQVTTWLVGIVVGVFVVHYFFGLFGPTADARIFVAIRDSASACDEYAFAVGFKGPARVDKVYFSMQFPRDIVEQRVAYSPINRIGRDFLGAQGTVIRKEGGCGFTTLQEGLSPNIQESSPYPNQLVIQGTDVQHPIVGLVLIRRPADLVLSDFHTGGFYEYRVMDTSHQQALLFDIDLTSPTQLPR